MVALRPTTSSAALSVTNPSFEAPITSGTVTTPTGWSVIDPADNRRIWGAPYVDASVTGAQAGGIGGGFSLGDNSGQGTDLFQNIGTTTSTWTHLQFNVDIARRADVFVPASSFTMGVWRDTNADLIPDLALGTLYVDGTTINGVGGQVFTTKTMTVYDIPAGTELYLRFRADNAPPGPTAYQTLLDNVQIAEVIPEPTAMALISALGLVLFCRRQK
jgi:hypothetical protein